MEGPTPDPEATIQTVDTLGHAIDDALGWDPLEEHNMLAQIEQRMFARARDPVRLSRYLLLRPLGSGGTGVVYDGYDPELARRVAVKVLRAGRKNQESVARARARFVREAQSIARLSHPNVIAVHDVGTYSAGDLAPGALDGLAQATPEDAGVFIVMELVDGQDLATWLERERRPWREILEVFIAAGQGLSAAHAAGIVHRDFKPGNVLVGEGGEVKVVDFGLALTYGGSLSESRDASTSTPVPPELASGTLSSGDGDDRLAVDKLTRTGTLLGTPAYMAPEQHRGEPADQQADQFAFCASLFRALYGRHAFSGRSLNNLFASKVAGRVEPAPTDSRVPAWVHRVILRGLSVDPSGRFVSMEELLRALRADPVRRWRRAARRAAVPVGLLGVGSAVYLATLPGRVVVSVAEGGASVADVRIYVDDQALPGGEGELSPGLHRVQVVAPDYEPVQTVVDVQRGGVHEVAVELRHEQGVFNLELSPGGGHIFVDGTDYGSRLKNFRIDTGPHELLLRHEGYVDQQLHWTARVDRPMQQFVALRKALAWTRPASGTLLEGRWLGDVNGDGLDDLVQRRFTVMTAYDPWNDAELWRVPLGTGAHYRLCDTDGDGARDLVVVRWGEEANAIELYDGASVERRPTPRWEVSLPHPGTPPTRLGEAICVARPDGGGADLVVAGLSDGRVLALGADGQERWGWEPPGLAINAAVLPRGEAPQMVAIVGVDGVYGLTAADGQLRWSSPVAVAARTAAAALEPAWHEAYARGFEQHQWWVAAAPLDDDPGDDLLLDVAGEGGGWAVVALGGADGRELWRRPVDKALPLSEQVVGDGDGDGASDLLLRPPGEGSPLALVSGRRGRTLWSRDVEPGHIRLVPRAPVAWVAVAQERRVELLDATTGTTFATAELSQRVTSGVVPFDWDGDGAQELVLGTRDGMLRALDGQLREVGTVPLPVRVSALDASRDANHDGFGDLLLQALGSAVVLGPKVRWDRRPDEAIRATPVVADLDGDGAMEVAVFGSMTRQGRGLNILDASTGRIESRRQPEDSQPVVIRPPALLPTERGHDLLAVGSGLFRFRGHDGKELDRFITGTAYASPTVVDLEGDGTLEVVVVTWEGPGMVYVLDADSFEPRWSHELGPQGSFGAPYAGDVDGDGALEVVVAVLDGRVVSLSAEGIKEWDRQTGGRLNFEPTVADLDDDGIPEVLVTPHVDEDNPLVVLSGRDGQQVARYPHVATRRARPAARDVDGDGRPEIFLVSKTQGMMSLAADGAQRWRYGFVDADGLQPAGAGSPVVADLEGDGRPELVAGFEDGTVHVVDMVDGSLIWRFRAGREEIEASPAVADVDGDGQLEVLVSGHDRHLFCLEHLPGSR